MITPLQQILEIFFSHQYMVPFISGFITEEVLIITTLISGEGTIPFYFILLFGFLGIVASDIMWFLLIKIKPFMAFSKKVGKERKKLAKKVHIKLPPPTNLKSYIFTKFTFGLRTWGIFYCSVHKMPLKKFILHTSIATAIWIIVMLSLAKLLGKGLYAYFNLTKDIGGIIVFIFIILIVWALASKFVLSKLTKNH